MVAVFQAGGEQAADAAHGVHVPLVVFAVAAGAPLGLLLVTFCTY